MSQSKKMYKMLEFYDEKKGEQTDDDKITSMTRLDSFKIDKKVDIDMGEVYFVTREKKFEDSDDSFMYYEIYSIKNPDKPIAKTNENFEIEILNDKINNEFLKNKLDLEKDKKVIREMVREDKDGNLVPTCAVMDKLDPDAKGSKLKQMEKVKKNTVHNTKTKDSLENEEKEILSEDKIKEKAVQEGKKIQLMSRIDDPMFYQLVPDATANTYFVTYEDGSLGVVNSRGIDIAGTDERGIRNGSLSLRKMDRNQIQTDSFDSTNLDLAIYIEGSSNTHGIVFPVVNTRGNYSMEMKDIYDKDQQSMPLSMQGTGNTKDNRKYLGLDEQIVETLNENGIEEPNDKDIEVLARYFYDKGNNEPDEISVLKEYKKIINREDIEENENEERTDRRPRGM